MNVRVLTGVGQVLIFLKTTGPSYDKKKLLKI
jgi:hypothetical protein